MLEPLNPDAVAASHSVLLILEVSIPQQFYIQCSKSRSEWATHYESVVPKEIAFATIHQAALGYAVRIEYIARDRHNVIMHYFRRAKSLSPEKIYDE